MSTLDRRGFHANTLAALSGYCLLQTLFEHDAFADPVRPIATEWLNRVNTISTDLKAGQLKQAQWQQQVEALYSKVELNDLLRLVNFEKIAADRRFNERGERSMPVHFPAVEGLPAKLVLGRQIFALQKGRSVVPHGHNNMATSFQILSGTFRGKHYDRLEDEKDHLIIRPTIDRDFAPGEYSTVTDAKDNIHWFTATSDTGYIFNMHVLNVSPDYKGIGGRVYVDPDGEKLSDGRIRARRTSHKDVLKKYG